MHRVVGAVVSSPNHVIEPGVVENEVPDRNILWVGEPDDRSSPRIEALRAALKAAGIGSPATTDIRYEIWHKLMANLPARRSAWSRGSPSRPEDAADQPAVAAGSCRGAGRRSRPRRCPRRPSGRALTGPSASIPAIVRRSCRTTTSAGRWRSNRSCARLGPSPAAPASIADAGCDRIDLCGLGPRQGAVHAVISRDALSFPPPSYGGGIPNERHARIGHVTMIEKTP